MSKIVMAEGRFLRLVSDGGWEYVERCRASGVVAIIPITRDGRIILVEQFRPPIGCQMIEIPAGIAGDIAGQESESFEVAARRELEEETGYSGGDWQLLGVSPSSAGLTTELITFFAALNVERSSSGGGVEHEQIVIHEVPLPELPEWLSQQAARGAMIDSKIFAALAMARCAF